jgi:hypothetical protein
MTDHAQRSVNGCRVLIIEDEYFPPLRLLGYEVIGPVPELGDAMSIEPDAFDVAVLDCGRTDTSPETIYFCNRLRC